ncbi:hypothetical protein MRX96_053091 [Rhipicephalus microplus]
MACTQTSQEKQRSQRQRKKNGGATAAGADENKRETRLKPASSVKSDGRLGVRPIGRFWRVRRLMDDVRAAAINQSENAGGGVAVSGPCVLRTQVKKASSCSRGCG